MGPMDIYLSSHVNCESTGTQLKSYALARTIATISGAGFKPVSFRYVKYFHAETMEELSEEQAKDADCYNGLLCITVFFHFPWRALRWSLAPC